MVLYMEAYDLYMIYCILKKNVPIYPFVRMFRKNSEDVIKDDLSFHIIWYLE